MTALNAGLERRLINIRIGRLVLGTGLLAFRLAVGNGSMRRQVIVAGVVLCLTPGAVLVLGTRIPRRVAIEKGLGYFSHLESPVLVGAWFGLERPSGSMKGFKMMNGRDRVMRPVWKIAVEHDSLFGSVWLAPWSGEIIAVDGPEKWIR